jgi:predicted RNA-binding protein with PUA-like domain
MVRAMAKQFWLMKSEPEQFGIADLARVKVEPWTGVRSFFARAHMRAMSVGDGVLFHHSNASPPGVAGLARVVRTQVIDETQFDPASPYHDPRATREKPIWDCVEVEYVATLPHFVSMDRMRAEPRLAEMILLQGRGMRLSVQPVTEAEYEVVVALGTTEPPPAAPKPARPAKRTASARPARGKKPRARAGRQGKRTAAPRAKVRPERKR